MPRVDNQAIRQAAVKYLAAREAELKAEQKLINLMERRGEPSVIVDDNVIEAVQHEYLVVTRHLNV